MAQGNVEFIKKATIKKHKTDADPITFSDEQNVEYSQRILNAAIDAGDLITDTEMPTSMFNATLDWTEGPVADDLVVKISKGNRIETIQDLASTNVHSGYIDRFKLRIVTSGVDEQFTIPTDVAYIADYAIDWGDTQSSDITAWDDAALTHTFSSAGTYDIEVKGKCEYLKFNNENRITELLEVENLDGLSEVSFEGCSNLTAINPTWNKWNKPTSFYGSFKGCSSLTEIPIGLFDNCADVINFGYAFSNTGITTVPDGLFNNNTNITSLFAAFYECTSLTSIPAGLFDNNPLVTSFSNTFYGCTSLLSIPDDLLLNNTAITTVINMFTACDSITTAVTGVGEFIADVTVAAPAATKTACFDGCTSITDYASIPIGAADWRTV